MYVGRFLIVGPQCGAYRVSSRSFPNRRIVERDDRLTVGPTADAEETDNPYVSYNCVRLTGNGAVLGNGSHVDPIAEKIDMGYPARDALATSLLALDYEKDDYDTPRIAGVLDEEGALIGIVRKDALLVERVSEPTLIGTYEKDSPEKIDFSPESAEEAARAVYDHEFEHAVCAAGVVRGGNGFSWAIENGQD
ncbi:MAG: IMP cyclohydrolase [Euryarchaeota archaeon]|nr:IMP cyclohydrolase [Euryarchaeota archaeon]